MRWRIGIGAAALTALLSCGGQRALVLLDVTADSELDDVLLTVSAGQSTASYAHVHLNEHVAYQIGMYLPSDVSGTVELHAEADDGVCVRGTGTATATGLGAGNTSAAVPLMIHVSHPDGCTTPDGGAGGSGGMAGAQGSAGAGGMTGAAGAGVAGAGTAGAAGTPGGAGETGAGGSTGVAGTSGIAGMGAGGTGAGGVTGTAGKGAAGSGAAGAAGKIGAAGMGGSGGLGVAGAGAAGSSGFAGASGGAPGTAGAGGAGTPSIQVVAQCQTTAAGPTTITLHFKILNPSNVAIPLNTVTARYFFTLTNQVAPIVEIDYLGLLVKGQVTFMSTTTYTEVGFMPNAGSLRAFDTTTGTGEIQIRMHPPNFTPPDWNADQTDDPSFKACTTTSSVFEPRPGFIGYLNGQQSWPAP